jgi:trk system potassium uptake protein
VTRLRRLRRPRPPQVILLAFLGAIAVGTFLLALPIAHAPGVRLTVSDALFMATSAVCVTGLIVVDTGSALSTFGQVVVALLIKAGGLGILTFGVLIAFATGQRLGVVDRLNLQAQTNRLALGGVVRFVRRLLVVTTTIELVGALVLWPAFARSHDVGAAAWLALFHSVSAWNNAGFSLFSDSLAGYVGDAWVTLTVAALFVAGGMGLPVIVDVADSVAAGWRRRGRPGTGRHLAPWTLHTRVALVSTAVLAVFGVLAIALLEWRNPATLGELPWHARALASVFHGLTPRTAGFNTVDVGAFGPAALVVTMGLMFVGGNPGSTAGGIKTTTLAVLVMSAWSVIRGRPGVQTFGRTLGSLLVARAAALATLAVLVMAVAITALAVTERGVPLPVLAFEAISAFGTVGLSMGVTPDLSEPGRMIVVTLMVVGRVGLLTFALALAAAPPARPLRYPHEDVVVG